MRSIPARTMDHSRSMHDIRHLGSIRHSTGRDDVFRQLDWLERERGRLEKCLATWVSQKERTEAQLAEVERDQARLLESLEPVIRREAAELEAPPRPFQPVPSARRRRAV